MSKAEMTETEWVKEYAQRILEAWKNQPSPLGIDEGYSRHLQEELRKYFGDPLKRAMIEMSY
jgi:hypothetical protein